MVSTIWNIKYLFKETERKVEHHKIFFYRKTLLISKLSYVGDKNKNYKRRFQYAKRIWFITLLKMSRHKLLFIIITRTFKLKKQLEQIDIWNKCGFTRFYVQKWWSNEIYEKWLSYIPVLLEDTVKGSHSLITDAIKLSQVWPTWPVTATLSGRNSRCSIIRSETSWCNCYGIYHQIYKIEHYLI